MTRLPSLLFKYRDLTNEGRVKRAIEIIDNHELFFPTRKKLNDPFEGINGRFLLSGGGYAGISIQIALDEEIPYIAEERNKYRILSLSEDCFSPLMWALYADEGRGVCFCFRTDGSFRTATTVEYCDPDKEIITVSPDEYDEKIKNDLFTKSICWQYEKEWRIIEQSEEPYFRFERNELVAVIFGYQMSRENKELIKKALPRETMLFKSHVGGQTKRIRLLPEELEYHPDGSEPPYIDTISKLSSIIFDK